MAQCQCEVQPREGISSKEGIKAGLQPPITAKQWPELGAERWASQAPKFLKGMGLERQGHDDKGAET